jgi:hypothetical protein
MSYFTLVVSIAVEADAIESLGALAISVHISP